MTISVKRFIFSGAPGSGKTSVIQDLELKGHVVIHEAATDIIACAQEKGIEKPWEEPGFVEDIAAMQKQRQERTQGALQFFDRSPFCTYALGIYLSQVSSTDFQPPKKLAEEIDRCLAMRIYQPNIFFFDNLGFIEHTDARKISYAEALAFEQIHVDTYQRFGFDLIFVPAAPISERQKYILDHIGK